MSTFLKELTQFFATHPNALEQFMASKAPKSHAEAEYWQKYFEYKGL